MEVPFDEIEDYRRHVDGRVREDGVGSEPGDDSRYLNPRLPDDLPGLRLEIGYRNQRIDIESTHHDVTLRTRPCDEAPVQVAVGDELITLPTGMTRIVLSTAAAAGETLFAGEGAALTSRRHPYDHPGELGHDRVGGRPGCVTNLDRAVM